MKFQTSSVLALLAATISVASGYISPKPPMSLNGVPHTAESCPFEYLLDAYKPNHFDKMLRFVNPAIDDDTRAVANTILDVFHTSLMLVDDVHDGSSERKGKTAAHLVFDQHPTTNRAYARLFQMLEDLAMNEDHQWAIPYVMEALAGCHRGQDTGLVWRRDSYFPSCESFLTNVVDPLNGSLFRLVGRLANKDKSYDGDMTKFGLYTKVQNDYKNLWGTYGEKRGEDIDNGEISYPILYALEHSVNELERKLLKQILLMSNNGPELKDEAIEIIESSGAKEKTLEFLDALEKETPHLAVLWGRNEHKKTEVGMETQKA